LNAKWEQEKKVLVKIVLIDETEKIVGELDVPEDL
jgi:hypothetical protein